MVAWLQQCKWGHSSDTDRKGLGENLWMVSRSGYNKTAAIISAVASWFSELKNKGVPTANKLTMDVFNRGVGHYTQLVWQRSDRIGCGIQDCPDRPMTYVGCEYQTAGNVINHYIYEIGDPCTEDKDFSKGFHSSKAMAGAGAGADEVS
ncbi:Ancylostoma secreted protein 2 [Trichostrongylus colubriformis]|uniref:Ancylostoma secreted protein 2 n=1 Tax=Trichostrongylus colubriformis TaxID=6319 RepID=A0AAN8EM91_TRICO